MYVNFDVNGLIGVLWRAQSRSTRPEISQAAPGVKLIARQIASVLGRSELNFPSQRREVSMILFLHHRVDIAIQTFALHHLSFYTFLSF